MIMVYCFWVPRLSSVCLTHTAAHGDDLIVVLAFYQTACSLLGLRFSVRSKQMLSTRQPSFGVGEPFFVPSSVLNSRSPRLSQIAPSLAPVCSRFVSRPR